MKYFEGCKIIIQERGTSDRLLLSTLPQLQRQRQQHYSHILQEVIGMHLSLHFCYISYLFLVLIARRQARKGVYSKEQDSSKAGTTSRSAFHIMIMIIIQRRCFAQREIPVPIW